MGNNDSLEVFLDILIGKHPKLESSRNFFWSNFDKSGLVSIEINSLKFGMAVSFPSKIIISPKVLNLELNHLLFTLFHEVAHQFQYKKYGTENMLKVHMGLFNKTDSISFMKQIEIVADDFAERKIKEMKKLGLIELNQIVPKGLYKSFKDSDFEKLIDISVKLLENEQFDNHEHVANILYRKILS